jgi:hypothetical protein
MSTRRRRESVEPPRNGRYRRQPYPSPDPTTEARCLGHGYATEAATATLQYAFEAGLRTVLAVTHPENAASQAVCRRLGMEHRGRTDRYYNMTCELFALAREPASRGGPCGQSA